ncbi:MAG: anaerobic ribonucleoside-triphosphate reductase [Planctomycetota bacterium]|nr:anaerobic ribonucleoside-triphosphate reductase [Planctomycetota bacterium]MDP7252430.1 anaerobic ribonucleoside-triphosphate reductase [Planctomycetota bacterium]
MTSLRSVLKRDGREVPFDKTKIADAIFRAAQVAGGESRSESEELTEAVVLFLERDFKEDPPPIEAIQDLVERVLIETGHAATAKAYILYRERRTRIRNSLKVRKPAPLDDASHVKVSPGTRDEIAIWDPEKIVLALEIEAQLEPEIAREIAHAVEQKILAAGMQQVTTLLIREMVDIELLLRGLSASLEKQSLFGMPKFDLDQLLFQRQKSNHKVVTNNPEALNLAIAERLLRQYALDEVFDKEVARAHLAGVIHIHDLGYPARIYLANHSLEFLKKFGLALETIDVASAPAKYPDTLTSQLFTFLGSMQSYAAGPQGIDYLNILFAPLLDELDDEAIYQEAQRLIFDGAQHASSRGGQTLCAELNIYPDVPQWLQGLPAIGKGGKPTGKSYGDYARTAGKFGSALLDVWERGDEYGGLFCFPKCNFHLSSSCFEDRPSSDLLAKAARVAATNGIPVFVFDRSDAPSLGVPLRTEWSSGLPLESLRGGVIQSVTINLPQAAYRAGSWDELWREVEKALGLAVKALQQKRRLVGRLSATSRLPLWQLGRTVRDGKPYLDLENAGCAIGLIGLNECMAFVTESHLHQSEICLDLAVKLLQRIRKRLQEFSVETGLKFFLEESPAENAARRLAKVDLNQFEIADIFVRGDAGADTARYTNGIKVRPEAAISYKERLQIEGRLHPFIDLHALSQIYVGEPGPSPDEILNTLKYAWERTGVSQLAFTPSFTFCHDCRATRRGQHELCTVCQSANTTGLTRIADYFCRTTEWNRSKLDEFRRRHLLSELK